MPRLDTTKILSFRHPSQASVLLESLLHSLDWLPENARRVQDRSELPSVLQRIAIRGARQQEKWLAWQRNSAIYFFTVKVTPPPAGVVRPPALRVSAYNERGSVTGCGVWANSPGKGWQRCVL